MLLDVVGCSLPFLFWVLPKCVGGCWMLDDAWCWRGCWWTLLLEDVGFPAVVTYDWMLWMVPKVLDAAGLPKSAAHHMLRGREHSEYSM